MLKQKKIIVLSVVAFCTLIAAFGAFFGVRAYLKNIERFTVNDTLPDGQGKKATVILLGGQSNASGCSRDDYLQRNVSAEQYAEYASGYDNVYINYFATKTNESQAFVKCSVCQGEAGGFFGPELGMAQKLNELYPDRTFFIIKYAWGGSNLHKQWASPSANKKTGELYKAFVKYVTASLHYLTEKNYDVKIEGMCWMQGESDSFSEETANDYQDNLESLIKDIRKKFSRYAADDGIAFVDAYIADNPAYWVYCGAVNRAKQAVADMSPINVVIDTVKEGLTCSFEPEDAPDMAHYDSLSEIKLGHLFIEGLAQFM